MLDTHQIRLLYESDREAALKALRDAGVQYQEAYDKATQSITEAWRAAQGDIKRFVMSALPDLLRSVGDAFTLTSQQMAGGRGGLGRQAERFLGDMGEALWGKMPEGFSKAVGPQMIGKMVEVSAITFSVYETIRMAGARLAPVVSAGRPQDLGGESFFNVGRHATARIIELRQATGESAQAILETVTQLSRVGIAFNDVGKSAGLYAIAADKVLNLQKGVTASLEAEAVTRYGQAWGDVRGVIADTVHVSNYWQAAARDAGDASLAAWASNQNLLNMYKSVRESTKGTSIDMNVLNRVFLSMASNMRGMGLRPEVITGTVGQFLAGIAPKLSGAREMITHGFFLRDMLSRSEEGRKLITTSMALSESQNIDPLSWELALTQMLSRDPTGETSQSLVSGILQGILVEREEMPGDVTNQNQLMRLKLEKMMGVGPLAGQMTITFAEQYKKNLERGQSPEAALRGAGESDEVREIASSMGLKDMPTETLIREIMMPMARASYSTSERLAMWVESFVGAEPVKAASQFWPKMSNIVRTALKDVVRSRHGEEAERKVGMLQIPGVVRSLLEPEEERARRGAGVPPPRKGPATSHLTGTYTTQTAGGVNQVGTYVSGDYFESIVAGIAQIETGGEQDPYTTIGVPSRSGDLPYGKYQVMGENVPSWTEAALGRAMTPLEFLSSPEAQEITARHKLGEYYQKYGTVEDVGSMWHSGRPLAEAQQRIDPLGTWTPAYVEKLRTFVGAHTEAQMNRSMRG